MTYSIVGSHKASYLQYYEIGSDINVIYLGGNYSCKLPYLTVGRVRIKFGAGYIIFKFKL